ncbi:PREDICTED: uncharacterized protein LOC105527291 [Colobus angolensis palliatus]|uniref:uncharacterized protein LOC105527291 n=1 Tax=Colobus angolensis palliatus TaxID=336983 RepID=UPI0005F40F98|nr:PREDICTED: uncharacterized protein LOC105527291 [Colobus angolensis palliatus]
MSFPNETGTFASIYLTVHVCNAVLINDQKDQEAKKALRREVTGGGGGCYGRFVGAVGLLREYSWSDRKAQAYARSSFRFPPSSSSPLQVLMDGRRLRRGGKNPWLVMSESCLNAQRGGRRERERDSKALSRVCAPARGARSPLGARAGAALLPTGSAGGCVREGEGSRGVGEEGVPAGGRGRGWREGGFTELQPGPRCACTSRLLKPKHVPKAVFSASGRFLHPQFPPLGLAATNSRTCRSQRAVILAPGFRIDPVRSGGGTSQLPSC